MHKAIGTALIAAAIVGGVGIGHASTTEDNKEDSR